MKAISHSLMFKYRGILGIIVFVPVILGVMLSSPRVQEDTVLDFVMDTCGWICFLLYAVVRIWATIYIGRRKDKELQTQGPYSVCRNPLYLGSFCFALSPAFFFESFSLLAAAFALGLIYLLLVIPAEEKVLGTLFGEEFYNYCQQTPRIIPSFKHYRSSSAIEVRVRGISLEVKRLLLACILPLSAEIIMCLRSAEWWPVLFNLP